MSPAPADRAAASAREVLLGIGLPDGPDRVGDAPVVLDQDAGRRWRGMVVADRTLGLALECIRTGAVQVEPPTLEELVASQRRSAAVALMLEARLVEVVDRLEAARIDHRVLKGPALAHTAYPDASWREFGDIDVLVPGGDLGRAVRALEAGGARRAFPPVGRRYEHSVAKSVTLRDRDGWEIDLHRTVATGPWGQLIDVGDLWCPPAVFDLGGREVRTLPPELHLAHALVHVGLGSPRPRASNLRDLLQLSRTSDHRSVLVVLRRWRALAPALSAREFLPGAWRAELDWLGHGPSSARERRWISLHRRDPQPFGRLTVEATLAARPRRLPGYLLAVAPLVRPAARRGRA